MNRKGFTLVEIMIVVAIIALLAAIAIPNLMRARLNANESAAQSTLKTVATAVESFRAAQTNPTYPPSSTVAGVVGLTDGTAASPSYCDAGIFAAAGRQGYIFTYTQLGTVLGQQYVASCQPVTFGVTGIRTFSINETGVLRASAANAAAITASPITTLAYAALTPVQ
ncbi:MAG: prepilin-type N-terminal cleavage/methylation domain-containing protein [Candidatus Omnitrophota bacterium]